MQEAAIDSQTITRIDKRSGLSHQELLAEYVAPGRPVVLTDAAQRWPALGKMTPEFMRDTYGHLVKQMSDGRQYTVAEYVELMLRSTPAQPAPYPFNFNIEKTMPELLADMQPQLAYGHADRIHHPLLPRFMLRGTEVYELFMGGNGAGFPYLHYDALCMNTQITQLYGAKEFILYAPDQTPYLYPKADNAKVSQVDTHQPDYDRFPRFREARPVRVTVEQGETILFPTGWWHTTRIHEPSISMGRAHLSEVNWQAYVEDVYALRRQRHPLVAALTRQYGRLLGRYMDRQERATAEMLKVEG